eukprot:5677816-Amphidinium_carterae.1
MESVSRHDTMSVSYTHSHSAPERAYSQRVNSHLTTLVSSTMTSTSASSFDASPRTPESYIHLDIKEQLLAHAEEDMFIHSTRKMKSDLFIKDTLFKAYSLFAPQWLTLVSKADISELTNTDLGEPEDNIFWCHTSITAVKDVCNEKGAFENKYIFPSTLSAMFHVAIHEHYQLGGGRLTSETIVVGFRYPQKFMKDVKPTVNGYSTSFKIENLAVENMSLVVGAIKLKGDQICDQINATKWQEEITQTSISHYEAIFSCKVLEDLQMTSTVISHSLYSGECGKIPATMERHCPTLFGELTKSRDAVLSAPTRKVIESTEYFSDGSIKRVKVERHF